MDKYATELPAIPQPMNQIRYATFWDRAVASVIDGLIISGAVGIISTLKTPPGWHNSFFDLYFIVIPWLYFGIMESSVKQATFGKSLNGIKVVNLEGQRISLGKSLLRSFSRQISGIIFGIGFLFFFFTKNNQSLHDLVAGTYVVKK